MHCQLYLWDKTFGQSHYTPLGHGQGTILATCTLRPQLQIYDFGSRSLHTFGSWTTIVSNIIQIRQRCKKLWPKHPNMMWTERWTNRQIPIYPLNFVCGGGVIDNCQRTFILSRSTWINQHIQTLETFFKSDMKQSNSENCGPRRN